MGSGRWDKGSWDAYARSASSLSTRELYKSHSVQKQYDAKHVTLRESRDSADNPLSTPIIIGLDVTGSMGFIAEHIAKSGLGTTIQSVLDRKPVTDPHLLIMAIGDIIYDRAPLQITQFEADNRLVEQLTGLYLEGGGGSNSYESYDGAWLFASAMTSTDSYEKRGNKGYLFTIGDEDCPVEYNVKGYNEHLNKVFPEQVAKQLANVSAKQALADASEKYHVFHLIITQGNGCANKSTRDRNIANWRKSLGDAAIIVDNYKYVPEVISSVIQVNEGDDPEEVINSWQTVEARATVRNALFPSK